MGFARLEISAPGLFLIFFRSRSCTSYLALGCFFQGRDSKESRAESGCQNSLINSFCGLLILVSVYTEIILKVCALDTDFYFMLFR